MKVRVTGQQPTHALLRQVNAEVAQLAGSHSDMLTLPTAVGLFEYAFLLPNCDRRNAEAVTDFAARTLRRHRCSFGVAVFPDDGQDSETLLRNALERCGVLNTLSAAA
jgi:hypothetical protein